MFPKNNIVFKKNLLFVIVNLLGLIYFSLLINFTRDLVSSCLVKLATVADIQEVIYGILTIPEFLLSFSGLIISLFLFYRFLNAVFRTYLDISKTNEFVKSLKYKELGDFKLFNSKSNNVFTHGLLNPEIFVSRKTRESLSDREFEAVILHEKFHVISKDPLKSLVFRFIKRAVPSFGLLDYLEQRYEIITELAADFFVQENLGSRKSLLSSLYKFMNESTISELNLKMFSGKNSRIKYLIGKENINFSFALALCAGYLFLLVSSVSGFTNISPLNKCTDFNYCTNAIMSNSDGGEKCITREYSSDDQRFMSEFKNFSQNN